MNQKSENPHPFGHGPWLLLANIQSLFSQKEGISYHKLATLKSAACSMVPKRVLIRECKHWQHDCPSPTTAGVDRLKIKDLCISYIDSKGTKLEISSNQ